MEIICVNGVFSPQQMELFSRYGVVVPVEDSIYTIRDVIKPSGKEGVGILLEEIVNPKIPLAHPIMDTVTHHEPNWAIHRFSTLSGEPLSREDIERIKQETTVKQIEPCK
jgi:hypothetical protein